MQKFEQCYTRSLTTVDIFHNVNIVHPPRRINLSILSPIIANARITLLIIQSASIANVYSNRTNNTNVVIML